MEADEPATQESSAQAAPRHYGFPISLVTRRTPAREESALPNLSRSTTLRHMGGVGTPAARSEAMTTRRMQLTRQRATHRADLEAEMSGLPFVMRSVLGGDDDNRRGGSASGPRSPTVDPIDLLIDAGAAVPPRRRHGYYHAVSRARANRRTMMGPRAFDDSPPDLVSEGALNTMDGLGDRLRSPSVEDGGWDTLRTSIRPDEQLPSASSSFTSTTGSTPSATASATTSISANGASSYRIVNSRLIVPTEACPDITDAQLASGVVCDDARDTFPPFAPSQRPSYEPSTQPRSFNEPSPENIVEERTQPWPAAAHARPASPHTGLGANVEALRSFRGAAALTRRNARLYAGDDDGTNSVAPAHLRSPSPASRVRALSPPDPDMPGLIPGSPERPRSTGPTRRFRAEASPRDRARESAGRANTNGAAARATAPLLDRPTVQLSISDALSLSRALVNRHQDRGASASLSPSYEPLSTAASPDALLVEELLQCGHELPNWLYEVAGLAMWDGVAGN